MVESLFSAASKVFEGRLDTKDMSSSAPDFEAVFTLVLDAVDKYNEQWETASKDQQVSLNVLLPPDIGKHLIVSHVSLLSGRNVGGRGCKSGGRRHHQR